MFINKRFTGMESYPAVVTFFTLAALGSYFWYVVGARNAWELVLAFFVSLLLACIFFNLGYERKYRTWHPKWRNKTLGNYWEVFECTYIGAGELLKGINTVIQMTFGNPTVKNKERRANVP